MFKVSALLAGAAILLSSCTTTETVYRYQPRPVPTEPQIQSLTMRGVQWKVLTKKELEETLDELRKNPDPNFALFALTPKGFESLSSNLVEINRFMQEQQQVIVYYREYIRATENPAPIPQPKPEV